MAYAFNDDKSKAEMADIIAEIIGRMYPVGSIYMSVRNVNPGTLFGGTWTAWGSGRVPVGINANDADFNTVEKTGGAKTHTLTVNEIPVHSHDVGVIEQTGGLSGVSSGSSLYVQTSTQMAVKTSTNAGGSQPHSILQPYITCYMWKRTA